MLCRVLGVKVRKNRINERLRVKTVSVTPDIDDTDGDQSQADSNKEKEEICDGNKGLKCGKPVLEGKPGIHCDLCMKWYHPPCQDVMGKAYEVLERSNLSWLCSFCKGRLPFLRK